MSNKDLDVFDIDGCITHDTLDPSDFITCSRCGRELFSGNGVGECAYEDCPHLNEHTDLLGVDWND